MHADDAELDEVRAGGAWGTVVPMVFCCFQLFFGLRGSFPP